jgi:hypothetical protein
MAPFLRNNSQGQPTPNEPRMTKVLGKRPRKQPIKCWGCERDHMYRDFPYRDEKVRTMHNVQKVYIVEDMGRSMPNICSTYVRDT